VQAFLKNRRENASLSSMRFDPPSFAWIQYRTKSFGSRCCAATAGGVIHKALWQIWRFTPTVSQPSGHDSEENLITLCSTCHASVHGDVG
jgi:hypothetical protein